MPVINAMAAQVAGRIGNDYSQLLANMPRKFFCLTFDQETAVWKTVLDAINRGVKNPYELSKIACDAVEKV